MTLTIAAAQYSSKKGDIVANAQMHVEFVRKAVEHQADFILFPELSLTGYEPELAAELATNADDPRLTPLKELARQHNITIVAGAPIARANLKPGIGAIVFAPEATTVYLKIHLHPGEDHYFSAGEKHAVVKVRDVPIGLAICADTAHAEHPAAVAKAGASIYAAGVLFVTEDNPIDIPMLRGYAVTHKMAILLSNHWGPTGSFVGVGGSGAWDEQGRLVIEAPKGTGLIIAKRDSGKWTGKAVPIHGR